MNPDGLEEDEDSEEVEADEEAAPAARPGGGGPHPLLFKQLKFDGAFVCRIFETMSKSHIH